MTDTMDCRAEDVLRILRDCFDVDTCEFIPPKKMLHHDSGGYSLTATPEVVLLELLSILTGGAEGESSGIMQAIATPPRELIRDPNCHIEEDSP